MVPLANLSLPKVSLPHSQVEQYSNFTLSRHIKNNLSNSLSVYFFLDFEPYLDPLFQHILFLLPSIGFPLITQKWSKLQLWHFAAFRNILLERLRSNLVFLTRSSFQILGKTQMEVFPFSGFLVNPLQKKIVRTPELVMILT